MTEKAKQFGNGFKATRFSYVDEQGNSIQQIRPLRIRDMSQEAMDQAQGIIAQAKAEAVLIQDQARANLAQVEQRGYMEGSQKGEIAGQDLILQQLTPYLEHFRLLSENLVRLREQQLKALEPQILQLAVDIAKKVIHEELSVNDEVVGKVAHAAICEAIDREDIVLHISPADHDFLKKYKPELLAIEGVKQISIEEDPTVEVGGCIVETQSGDIDARLDVQLSRFEEQGEQFDA